MCHDFILWWLLIYIRGQHTANIDLLFLSYLSCVYYLLYSGMCLPSTTNVMKSSGAVSQSCHPHGYYDCRQREQERPNSICDPIYGIDFPSLRNNLRFLPKQLVYQVYRYRCHSWNCSCHEWKTASTFCNLKEITFNIFWNNIFLILWTKNSHPKLPVFLEFNNSVQERGLWIYKAHHDNHMGTINYKCAAYNRSEQGHHSLG